MATYSNTKDSYLYDEMGKNLIRALRALREEQCKANKRTKTGRYAARAAEQGAVMNGETASLGRDQFVTSAGRAWYQYRCKRIMVTARTTNDGMCYNSLPVFMGEEDYKEYVALCTRQHLHLHQGKEGDSIPPPQTTPRNRFFLESKTKRLLSHSMAEPCHACSPSLQCFRTPLGAGFTTPPKEFRWPPNPEWSPGRHWT